MADTPTDVRQILYRLAQVSSRPRYAFMVLNLISEVADPHGKAGPLIGCGPEATTVRDWLSDALAPLASQRRRAAPCRASDRAGRRRRARLRHACRSRSPTSAPFRQDQYQPGGFGPCPDRPCAPPLPGLAHQSRQPRRRPPGGLHSRASGSRRFATANPPHLMSTDEA